MKRSNSTHTNTTTLTRTSLKLVRSPFHGWRTKPGCTSSSSALSTRSSRFACSISFPLPPLPYWLPSQPSQSIVDDIQANEASFVPWYNSNEPEKFPIPILEPKISDLEEVCMLCIWKQWNNVCMNSMYSSKAQSFVFSNRKFMASLFYIRLCITSTDCWFCDASGSPNLYIQYITYDLNFFT